MAFEYSPYILPLLAVAMISIVTVIYSWMRRSANGAYAIALMSLAVVTWSVGYALEIAGADLGTKYFWGVIQYFGIAFAPFAWLIFAMSYSGENIEFAWLKRFEYIKFPKPTSLLLAIIPITTVLLALTTKSHGLIWSEYHIEQTGGFSALGVSHGVWFYIHLAYSYVLLLAGTILILRAIFAKQGLYRRQVVLMLIAMLAPWIGNVIFLTGNSPIPNLDITPFAFSISAAALTWAIFGFHLVDIAPVARDLIIESMQDGMVVIDVRGNIVDMNSAAAHFIGVRISEAVGKNGGEIFAPWPHLIERFRNVVDATEQISIGAGNAVRHYEIRFSPLKDGQGQLAGRLIMMRPVEEELIVQPKVTTTELPPQTAPAPDTYIQPQPRPGLFSSLVGFFSIPVKTDLEIPKDMNPGWYQARERSFTIILRIAALFGTAAYIFTLPSMHSPTLDNVNLAFGLVIGLLWFLGLARTLNFRTRAALFLFLVYVLGFVETQNFGFSVESFVFFLTLIITSVLLTGRAGGWIAAGASIITLLSFSWLIGTRSFMPYNLDATTVTPRTFEMGLTSIFVFSASAFALSISTTILMESLNHAWQSESQASNLLQQERDLLEQRVEERTRALETANNETLEANRRLHRLSQAVDQSGNTTIIMDRNGRIEYANPSFTTMTGYLPAEAHGKFASELLNSQKDGVDFRNEEWLREASAGKTWHGIFNNQRKDGSKYWELASIAPVYDQNGEITNYVQVSQNVTAQIILQEQLQNQNDYLSVLHQVTLDLLNRRDMNDLLQAIVDQSAILLDAPFSELMLEEEGNLVVEAFTSNMQSIKGDVASRSEAVVSWQAFDTLEPVTLEDYSTWSQKREVYNEYNLRAVADFPVIAGNRCLGILALGRSQPGYAFTPEQIQTGILFARLTALVLDNANLYNSAMQEISERKRTEALLQESEARFRQIVENAGDMIYRMDINGNFIYANPSALNTMGFKSEEEVLGRNYLELTTPEARHRLKRTYERQLIGKIKNTYFEFPAVTADGRIIWVGQNVQLTMDGEEVTGFQALGRDITELKQTQEALLLARDQALEASRLKSQLLSRVSHELRTPLGGILGYSELLQQNAFGKLNEKQNGAVNQIIESTHYLTKTVNDILDEAQIEAKSLNLHYEYFSVADMLDHVKTTISVLAEKKKLSLNTEVSPELPVELYGDQHRIRQILINLAGNAVKFTKQGGISIKLTRPTPAQWSIEVHDTGAGIPSDEFETIFQPFRQVNNSITRENRGSGLGLSITKHLIELMGGNITVQSQLGKGSAFIVTLPIINAPGE
jgi:PAS domain S-box-containing protein